MSIDKHCKPGWSHFYLKNLIYLQHMKNKGFTLIELLVIIAIISILATIIITLLGPARLKAKDSAVASSLASYRTQAQLVFTGDFTGLCSSPSLLEIETYVVSQGGTISSCDDGEDLYRVIAGLPSSFAQTIPATAYAAGEDGYCVNSLGDSRKVSIADMVNTTAPSCGEASGNSGSEVVTPPTPTYRLMCSFSCSGRRCDSSAMQEICQQITPTKQNAAMSSCSHLPPITCGDGGTSRN